MVGVHGPADSGYDLWPTTFPRDQKYQSEAHLSEHTRWRRGLILESGETPASILHNCLHCTELIMPVHLHTVVLLILSNVFMTFAWYGHLKNLATYSWVLAALVSWSIALFEYLLQVPANRIGHQVMTVGQLKVLQEVITLSVFVPFAVFYMRERLTLDYLWAGLCLVGAAYFIFRGPMSGG
jgi:hypothetical protein